MAPRRSPSDDIPTLVASAALIRMNLADEDISARELRHKKRVGFSHQWQAEAWDFYSALGELHFAHSYAGNTLGRLRWELAWETDDGNTVPLFDEDGQVAEGADPVLAEIAQRALRSLVGAGGSHAEWARPLGTALSCIGEGYLIGYHTNDDGDPTPGEVQVGVDPFGQPILEPNPAAVQVIWEAFAPTEIQTRNDRIRVTRTRDGDAEELPDDTVLVRIWRRHPRWPDDADSPMEALLTDCEDLQLLSRAIRASGLSRVHAGVLLIPQEGLGVPLTNIAGQQGPDGGVEHPVVNELVAGLVTPARDPGSASALVPTVITTRAEFIDKWKHLELNRTIDPQQAEQRTELIRRIAQGLDMPPEVLLGMGDVNHWSAWQIGEDAWRQIEPTADIAAAGVTTGFLWPTILAEVTAEDGTALIERDQVRRVRVAHDPSKILANPDLGEVADEAFDRGAISAASYRRAKGFTEEDAPDEDEIRTRRELELPPFAPLRRSATSAPEDATAAPGIPATADAPDSPVTAAAPLDPFSRAVADLELSFLNELLAAADSATDEAARKANARLRSAVQRDPGSQHLRPMLRGQPTEDVARLLGPREVARIAAFQNEDDDGDGIDALFAGALAFLLGRYRSLVAATHREYGAILARYFGIELDETERRRQEEDAIAGEAVLEGTATLWARERLYDRNAGRPDPESPGETIAGARIPGVVGRRAAARAGGVPVGVSLEPLPIYEGGVVSGPTASDALLSRGFLRSGIVWVYGSAVREAPFRPHRRVDGEVFESYEAMLEETEPLRRREADWLRGPGLHPGDHRGCRCHTADIWISPDT